ncbi:hypothetical protein RINTU1_07080 [Candidatus Regiella insecticola]|uniref:Uncharacterized protein n=1 Tax=Candidatus Regiella insecticola TaxID=138073 RepID=A0A6L2ZM72_9ENTR|nr:hypothetical protein RINTU1_07080 [Candidatus Regiella insecticola]
MKIATVKSCNRVIIHLPAKINTNKVMLRRGKKLNVCSLDLLPNSKISVLVLVIN